MRQRLCKAMSQCRMASAFQRLIHLLMLFLLPLCAGALWSLAARLLHRDLPWASPVSYTHLTLPTIYCV